LVWEQHVHEYSLIQALLAQVERLADAQGAGEVEEVRVKAGPLSGVEPVLLATAFQLLAPSTSVGSARLVIEEVPLMARCADCRREFEVLHFQFRCPVCESRTIEVTAGDAFMLESITFQQGATTGIGA
jgi:hydrogenase nickel incorporation protein HypA/HybF